VSSNEPVKNGCEVIYEMLHIRSSIYETFHISLHITQQFPCSLKVILRYTLFPKSKWLCSLVP